MGKHIFEIETQPENDNGRKRVKRIGSFKLIIETFVFQIKFHPMIVFIISSIKKLMIMKGKHRNWFIG